MSVRCPIAPGIAVPHAEIDIAHGLDWDGTAGVVHENVELLKDCTAPWVDSELIEAARSRAKSNPHDGDFDPLHDVQQATTPEQFHTIVERFIADNPQNRTTIYEDTAPYIQRAQAVGAVLFGLTHGKNPLWQLGKIANGIRRVQRTMGTHGIFYVEVMTGEKAKGPHLANIQGTENTFDFMAVNEHNDPLLVIHAKSIALGDDRGYSFAGLPHDCSGSHVKHLGISKSRQKEMVHADLRNRVHVVRDLGEISLGSQLTPTDCNRLPYNPTSLTRAAFRPLYNQGNAQPGTLITPRVMSADLIRETTRYPVKNR
jgi:hypothetical protein